MATVRVELSPQMLDELSFSSSADVCQAETFVCLISNYSNKPGPSIHPLILNLYVDKLGAWCKQQLHSSVSWSSRLLHGNHLAVWPCHFSLTV